MYLKKIKLEPAIIWKQVTCQRITSKRYSTSMGRHLSPRYGQVILVSGYLVLTAVNWSQHWCAISGLPKKRECVRVNIGMPVVRTDGLSGGRAVSRCTVTWLPNFLGWVVYFIFLPMLLRSANVKSLIILRLGERVTSFTKDSSANLCSEK